MTRRIFLLLCALPMLAALPARAGGLADMVEAAWARHPQAQAMPSRETAVAARGEVAGSLLPGAPSVSLATLNDRMNRDRGQEEWEVEMALPLWLPGQRAARMAEAESMAVEVAAQREAMRLQLAGEVRDAWWALAAARAAAVLAKQRAETAQRLEADVERRLRAGEVSRIDANLASGERLAAEAEVEETSLALLAAEQGFGNLVGLPAPQTLSPEGGEAALPAPTIDADPRWRAAVAAADLARDRRRVVGESRREAPELAFRFKRDRGGFDEPFANAVGVKLTIPLSSEPRLRQEVADAEAEAMQAGAEAGRLRQRLERDRQQATSALASARRQLVAAETRRALAADTLQLTEKAYALGETDLPTLLRVRAAAFEAEANHARQSIARAAAWSRLRQAMGVLP